RPGSGRWVIVTMLCVYSGGAAAWLNVLLDRDSARLEQTVTTFKHVSGSRRLMFSLKLDPWGSHKEAQTLSVSQAVFNSVSPGETVCVREHRGLLGWHWTEVLPCPQATANAGALG